MRANERKIDQKSVFLLILAKNNGSEVVFESEKFKIFLAKVSKNIF